MLFRARQWPPSTRIWQSTTNLDGSPLGWLGGEAGYSECGSLHPRHWSGFIQPTTGTEIEWVKTVVTTMPWTWKELTINTSLGISVKQERKSSMTAASNRRHSRKSHFGFSRSGTGMAVLRRPRDTVTTVVGAHPAWSADRALGILPEHRGRL